MCLYTTPINWRYANVQSGEGNPFEIEPDRNQQENRTTDSC
jgi:hypothetical protein